MDHVTIEEGNIVELYLLGRLSAEDQARFEEHFLDCEQCLEQLELGRRLQQGLRGVAAEQGSQVVQAAWLAWWLRRGRAFTATAALAVVALVLLPWIFLTPQLSRLDDESRRLKLELEQALEPRARTLTYALSPERSGSSGPPSAQITLQPEPEWILLSLDLPPFQIPSSYRLRLTSESGTTWQSAEQRSDGSGRIELSLHSTWLEPGDYALELIPIDGSDSVPASRFEFGARRQP